MHEFEKVYFSNRVTTTVDGHNFSYANYQKLDRVWDWIEENGISVAENGVDENGDFIIFVNKSDAVLFKLWLT